MKSEFLVPVITVFDKNGNIDASANKKLWDYVISGGVDGLLMLGSTGEFFSMTIKEKEQLISLACESLKGRTKLIFGTCCENIADTVKLSQFAIDSGADGVAVLTPYYFALKQENVELFYDEIATAVNGNVYIYNYPERTGHDIAPETVLNLVKKHKNIVGLKDSVGVMSHTRELINLIKPQFKDFKIYCGLDENFVHNILSGGDGCVGGFGNIMPKLCADLRDAVNGMDMCTVYNLQKKINYGVSLYAVTSPFVPAIKTAVNLKKVTDNDLCRKPLISSTETERKEIAEILKSLE